MLKIERIFLKRHLTIFKTLLNCPYFHQLPCLVSLSGNGKMVFISGSSAELPEPKHLSSWEKDIRSFVKIITAYP